MPENEPPSEKKAVEIPASLRKRGIVGVQDNLKPGQSLDVAKAFLHIFRPEIEALLAKRQTDKK